MNLNAPPVWLHFALIALLVCIAYATAIDGEFQFDDMQAIRSNLEIKSIKQVLDRNLVSGILTGRRQLTDLTFSLNYYVGRLDTRGYHIFSIILHIAVSWTVLLLVRTMLFSATVSAVEKTFLPLLTASLFAVHPVNTEAVSYLSQRSEILSALFYLASLLLFIRAFETEKRIVCLLLYTAATVSFLIALSSKITAITLPAMLFLYDYLFMGKRSLARSLFYYGPMALCGGAIALLFLLKMGNSPDIGFSIEGVTAYQYLLTQVKVVLTYIRLLFLPVNQNLDYDYPLSTGFFEPATFFSFVALAAAVAAAAVLARREKIAAFGIFWFFVALLPTSSIVPVVDVIFEHRLYFPSIGFALVISWLFLRLIAKTGQTGRNRWVARSCAACILLLVSGLLMATINRNRVWQSKIALWSDVVSKSPLKIRAHMNLGHAMNEKGLYKEAAGILRQAALLRDDGSAKKEDIYREWGYALFMQGSLDEAISVFQEGLNHAPGDPPLLNNLAIAFLEKGDDMRAMEYARLALTVRPAFGDALNTMGTAYYRRGDYEKALPYFIEAIRIDPDIPQRYWNAAVSLEYLGNVASARDYFMRYLQVETAEEGRRDAHERIKRLQGRHDDQQ